MTVVLTLASGTKIYPEKIEASYRRSPYVKEICVLREGESTTEGLYAVVVPNLELMRERRIVNVGDLLRFEMEGRAVYLPLHERVSGYEIWFDALPRTATGTFERHEIEKRVRQKQREAEQSAGKPAAAPGEWSNDRHARDAVAVIAKRTKGRITSTSNLEIDLGLDSIDRVALITELEQQFSVHVPEEQAQQIFTVSQLIEAVRQGPQASEPSTAGDPWAVLLGELPPPTDPLLSGLLERRPFAAPALFLVVRVLRLIMPRVEVTGLDHLAQQGPYIICPNHQSYLDPFIICGVLPYRVFEQLFFVGAAEYFETPLTRWVAKLGNCVPVDPDANLVPAMKAGAFGLTHGKVLMLFPEGERSIDGTVKRFKKGAPILSRHLDAPIVPVAIRGAFEVWPRNRGLDWKTFLPWSGHRVHVAIGAPVVLDRSLTYADAATALRGRVERMWTALG